MKELKFQDLLKLYEEGKQVDTSLYAEQRSNLMLTAGNHYTRKNSRFWGRIRDDKGLTQEQKLRLTKNHIQRICKIYENNILSYAPGVSIVAKNQSELKDQKAAELNNAVWQDIKYRHRMKEKTREFVQDFIRIGETACKVYWDETKGVLQGYEALVDDNGQPVIDSSGQPQADKKKPKFSGDFVFERIFGFNLFRAKEAKNLRDSWFLGLRKMVDVEEMKTRVGNDPEKLKLIQASRDETYLVFDGNNMSYSEAQNQCLLLEYYIRPSINYPEGYFYICTQQGILWEGPLPFGVFPIITEGFDEVPTNPRSHSIIKHLRPYQAEINRASSKVAETQITLGDDKVMIQTGTKIQNGGMLPGVRAIQYTGQPPVFLPGRAGDQYVAYIQNQIQEMYLVANLAEDLEEKPQQTDPFTTMYQSMAQKKKYSIYSTKLMDFLIEICDVTLKLAKEYLNEDALIPMIGRSEFVNIAEFKTTEPLNFSIKLEEGTEDMETKFGRQLMFNNILQYVGSSLDKRQLGLLFRMSPYANNEQAFEELTIDVDNATNMILALDRGKQVIPNKNDDPDYMMKRLVQRMRKADFPQLPMQVQQLYEQTYQTYIQIQTDEQRKIQEAALGYIPMSGMAVVCDLYVPDPSNKSKTMRARVPYDALTWLLKRLEEQGSSQQALLQQHQGVLADMASELAKNPPQAPQQMNGQGAGENMQPVLTQQ
jgi:hypothetical protein